MKRDATELTRTRGQFGWRSVAIMVVWFLLDSSAAFAQQRIAGTVTDKNTHSPIPGATVKLDSSLLPSELTATTDGKGSFSFADLSPGQYSVSATAERFYQEQVTLALAPRAIQQIYFELNPVGSLNEQVTVTAENKLLSETQSATVTTLTCEQLYRLGGVRCGQMTDAITLFVASGVAGHDNLVQVRGNELSLNTFVNGVSFFDNPHQLFTPGLAPEVVQSVNIITGGFPAEFGNRFGGILDLVTRSGFDSSGHGSLTIGGGDALRNNAALDYGGETEKFGYFLYAQAFESQRYLNTAEARGLHDFGKGSRNFAQLDYRPDLNDFFKLVLTAGGTNFQLPNTAEDQMTGLDFFSRNREQTAMLSWEHVFSSTVAVSTSLYERLVSSRLVPTTDPTSIQAGGLRNDLTLGAKSDYSKFIGQISFLRGRCRIHSN